MPGDGVTHRILFMRHPETVSNVEKYLSGRLDVGLSPRGLEQRDRAVEALVAFAPDRIWCSPLSRARDLAELAAGRLGVACEAHDDLIELDFGPLEGVPSSEAIGSGAFPWPLDEAGVSLPAEGAESFEHLRLRAERVIADLLPRKGRTACVTHGGFLRMLVAAAYQIPTTRFWDQSILNVSSLLFTSEGTSLALGGYNLTPEEVVGHSLEPSPYDTRDIWGAKERTRP